MSTYKWKLNAYRQFKLANLLKDKDGWTLRKEMDKQVKNDASGIPSIVFPVCRHKCQSKFIYSLIEKINYDIEEHNKEVRIFNKMNSKEKHDRL